MSDVDSLKKEINRLKRANKNFEKRVCVIEEELDIVEVEEVEEVHKEKVSSKRNNSGEEVPGHLGKILIGLGILVFFTSISFPLGVFLLVIGVLFESRRRNIIEEKEGKKKSKSSAKKSHSAGVKKSKSKTKKDFAEEDFGMKWFGRIGILALVFGVGFFIKYAIDNGWISHLARIVIGCAFGIGLMIFGELVSKKKKYVDWGKTLVAGGFAITYFSTYAAYHFESYRNAIGISLGLDIFLLSAIVLLAVLYALRESSQHVVGAAFFLGYLTAFLGSSFEMLTLVYTLILTIGLVIISYQKKWTVLGVFAVVASYILYAINYTSDTTSFAYSKYFLISYFFIFLIQSLLMIRNKSRVKENIGMILMNSFFFFFLYYSQLKALNSEYTGAFSLALAVIYFMAYFISQINKAKLISFVYLYLALAYATITIPLQLNKDLVTVIFAIEALILMMVYVKSSIAPLKISAYILSLIIVMKTLIYDFEALASLNVSNILLSTRLISFVVTATCFYFIYNIIKNNSKLFSEEGDGAAVIYSWVSAMMLVLIILLEFSGSYSLFTTLLLAALAFVLASLADNKSNTFFYQVFVISAVLLGKTLLYDSWNLGAFDVYNVLSSTRVAAFAIVIFCLYSAYAFFTGDKKFVSEDQVLISKGYSYAASGLMILIIFIELLRNHSVLASVLLAVFALILFVVSSENREEFAIQGFLVSAVLFFKVLFYDSQALDGFNQFNLVASTRIMSFAVAIILFQIISWGIERTKRFPEGKYAHSYASAFLAFVLIALELDEILISVGWIILALIIMVAGFVFVKKYLRMQSMLIFSVAILKVFLYDTRNLEAIYRTLSFIVLGIVLLLVSFIYTKYKDKIRKIL